MSDSPVEAGEVFLGLRESAALLNISEERMRTLAREGTVAGTKVDVNGKPEWRFSLEVLLERAEKAESGGGNKSEGGSVLRVRGITDTNRQALTDFCAENGLTLEKAYTTEDPAKAKARRDKKKADQAILAANLRADLAKKGITVPSKG